MAAVDGRTQVVFQVELVSGYSSPKEMPIMCW